MCWVNDYYVWLINICVSDVNMSTLEFYVFKCIEFIVIFSASCVLMGLLILVYVLYQINNVLVYIHCKFRDIILTCWLFVDKWTIPRMILCMKFKHRIVSNMSERANRRKFKPPVNSDSNVEQLSKPQKTNFTDMP